MFNIVLIEPEIPPNTGNVGRLCMATQSTLHLVKPLGFSLEDRQLKRAGLDYWDEVNVRLWNSFNDLQRMQSPNTRYLFLTTKTKRATRIILVSGGWWYWKAGYWYPAWGYAPYAYYPYDGPIYTGYADLTPDRVVINVQVQLQRDGYYFGAIDGILGPETRTALAAFQAEHGLAITSAIDEPTIATLGLA
jgi:hypothetical protein